MAKYPMTHEVQLKPGQTLLVWCQEDGVFHRMSYEYIFSLIPKKKHSKREVPVSQNKIYFLHNATLGSAADFFLKRKKPVSEKEEEKYGVDYSMPDCRYVKKFLEQHPEYVYLGSTDNAHANGWGMRFVGFKKVECPEA